MEPVELSGNGLTLRPWRSSDADAVYRACQDSDIRRWTTVPDPYTREDAVAFVSEIAPRGWAEGTDAAFGVFDSDGTELLGSCGLRCDLSTKTGEIGYWVAPWARRRRVAERAARLVVEWGFETLKLQRIGWRAVVGNHASKLVAERIGFRMEGIQRAVPDPQCGVCDMWTASRLPGEVATVSVDSRRAATFMAPQPELTAVAPGGPITLRRPTTNDLDDVVAATSDAESLRWTTLPDPYHRRDAEWFVLTRAPRKWTQGVGACFGVYDAEDRHCGFVDLNIVPYPPDVGVVGFLIAPWARGRGYGSTALRTMCEWAFEALALERIEWRAYVGNVASRRAAEKAGFQVEGTQRRYLVQRGERRDCWTAALLRTDVS